MRLILVCVFTLLCNGCIHSTFRYQANTVDKNSGIEAKVYAEVPLNTAEYTSCLLFFPFCFIAYQMPTDRQKLDVKRIVKKVLKKNNFSRPKSEQVELLKFRYSETIIDVHSHSEKKLLSYSKPSNDLVRLEFGLLPISHNLSGKLLTGITVHDGFEIVLGHRFQSVYRDKSHNFNFGGMRWYPIRTFRPESYEIYDGIFIESGYGRYTSLWERSILKEKTSYSGYYYTLGYTAHSGFAVDLGGQVVLQGDAEDFADLTPFVGLSYKL